MSFTQQYFSDAQKIIMGVLKELRPELMEHSGKIEHELKHDQSIVTRLDKEVELKLKQALQKMDSSVGFWGEEHGQTGDQKNLWLVDPIDGTEHFARGWPLARNLITFIANDKPVFSLAYLFGTDDLYVATEGKGATKNGQQLRMSNRPLNRSWIEFSVRLLEPRGYEMYKTLRPHVNGILSTYHFFYILDGYIEGMVVYKSQGDVWDYAPRTFFIQEAGGRVANFGSDKYNWRDCNVIATNEVIFEEVHKLLSPLA